MTSQTSSFSQPENEPGIAMLRTRRVMFPPPRGATGTSVAGTSATGYGMVATAVASATRPVPASVICSPTGAYTASATPANTCVRKRWWVWPATVTSTSAASGMTSASWLSRVKVRVSPAPRSTTYSPVGDQSLRTVGSIDSRTDPAWSRTTYALIDTSEYADMS